MRRTTGLLPRGFDKAQRAGPTSPSQGAAAADATSWAAADRVRYRVELDPAAQAAPLTVDGGAAVSIDRLSLGGESARLLRAGDRAVHRYYEEAAAGSAMPVARATAVVPEPLR